MVFAGMVCAIGVMLNHNPLVYFSGVIFVFAAILTPTGDPVTLTMMAAPMILLYILSIGIAWVFGKRDVEDD